MTGQSRGALESEARPPARPFSIAEIGWPLLIGVSGLILRLSVAREYAGHPIGRIPWVDEAAYWSSAREILGGKWLPDRPFYQDPLLSYLLAGLMRLLGTTEVATLRVAMACLGSLTPLAVYWAGRIGIGRAEAVVAGMATAFYGPLVFTDALLEKEGPAALVAALALGLSARAIAPGRRAGSAMAAGLAWGVLSLFRANALAIGPVVAILLFAGVGGGPREGRRARALAMFAGFAAALAPVTAINAIVSRPTEWIVTTWQGGANFYIGNGPEATGTYLAPAFVEANPAREAMDFAAEAERRAGRSLTPGAVSRFWLGQGMQRWKEAPGASLGLLGRKFGLLTHDFEIPDNQDAEVVRVIAAPTLDWGALGFGVLLPFAALGLTRSPRTPFWWVLTTTALVGLGSTAAFFVVGRYRIPWVPGLALLAGNGAVDLARLARGRRWKGLAWRILLVAAPVAALAWRPIADPAPDRWAHAQIGLALAYLEAGDLEPAIDALDDASALGTGPAARVAELREGSKLREPLAALIAKSWKAERSPLQRARWLRQLPAGRRESFNLLELEQYLHPDQPGPSRELAAWWLGQANAPEARRRAASCLSAAIRSGAADPSASVLAALLTGDPKRLPADEGAADTPSTVRNRLARAFLRTHHRSP